MVKLCRLIQLARAITTKIQDKLLVTTFSCHNWATSGRNLSTAKMVCSGWQHRSKLVLTCIWGFCLSCELPVLRRLCEHPLTLKALIWREDETKQGGVSTNWTSLKFPGCVPISSASNRSSLTARPVAIPSNSPGSTAGIYRRERSKNHNVRLVCNVDCRYVTVKDKVKN